MAFSRCSAGIPACISFGVNQRSCSQDGCATFSDRLLEVEVLNATLPDPPDYSFYLNIWQDPNGVARAHKVELWSEEHWRLLSAYGENLAQHGEKSIMTSIIDDPWNSQTGYLFPSMVEWRYPGEWKVGGTAAFQWDFTLFDRYVNTMIAAGVKGKIDMYAMVKGPGPTPDASIRYYDTRAKVRRTESLKVGESKWREAWKAFLPPSRCTSWKRDGGVLPIWDLTKNPRKSWTSCSSLPGKWLQISD